MKSQSKTYGNKTNKQWYFERVYNNNPNLSNKEIADILSYDIDDTDVKTVEVMKSRYKAKLKARIKGDDEYNKAVKKIFKDEDVLNIVKASFFKSAKDIVDTDFKDPKDKIRIYEKVLDVVS